MKQIDKSLLLTSASSKVPLLHSTQISLHRIAPSFDVVVGDTNENSLAFHFASRVWIMPLANDKNLGVILDGCLERNIKIILPTRDGELLFFAKHKIRFKENGIDVLVSNPLSVSRCLDKLLFYHYLNDLGFPAIPTSTDIESYSGTQFVVKERFGSGSLRVKKNVSAEDCLTVASTFQSPIIQPMIFGREFSVDVWVAENGTHAIASGRFRDYVVNGEAKVTSTFRDTYIEEVSISIAKALGISGLCVLQGFILDDETLLFIECNARIGGATTASINSGVPLIELLIADALRLDTAQILSQVSRNTITQIRAPYDYCL